MFICFPVNIFELYSEMLLNYLGTLGSFASCFKVLLDIVVLSQWLIFPYLEGKKFLLSTPIKDLYIMIFFLTLACRIVPSNPFRGFPLSLGYFIAHICWSLISSIFEKNPLQVSRIFSLCSSLRSDTLPAKSSHFFYHPGSHLYLLNSGRTLHL